MKIYKSDNRYIVRLETGEEILDSLKKVCADNNIKLGTISGLGSVSEVETALYHFENKEYFKKTYNGMFEVSNLIGNISEMNDEVYLHVHITFAGNDFKAIAGHMAKAVTGATMELVITAMEGKVDRYFDENVGLNLYKI